MLAIRMQRTGRRGLASFRVIVQDSRFSPTSGRVVAKLGHHNPHTKETVINKEEAEKYMANGAQPSPRVVRLFEQENIAVPDWVEKLRTDRARDIKNPEKLRKNRPAEEAAPQSDEQGAESKEEAVAEESKTDAKPEEAEEKPAEQPADEAPDQKPEEKSDEAPADEPAAEPTEETPEEPAEKSDKDAKDEEKPAEK